MYTGAQYRTLLCKVQANEFVKGDECNVMGFTKHGYRDTRNSLE